MKQKHIIIGGITMVGIVTLAVVGVNAYRKNRKKKKQQLADAAKQLVSLSDQPNSTITRPSTIPSKTAGTFPLAKWNGGPILSLVQELQKALMKIPSVAALISNSGGADGKLGNQTEKGINQLGFQLPLSSVDYAKIVAFAESPQTVPINPSSPSRKTVVTSRGRRFVSTQ